MLTVALSQGHGLAMLVGVLSAFVVTGGGFMVGKARRIYGIEYPTMYAPEGHKFENAFNCCQRAHQNVLENYPTFLMLLAIAAIKRPEVAAIFGLIRLAGFVVYMHGYSSGDPKKRMRGAFGYIGLFGLLGLALEVCYSVIMS